VAAEAPKKHTPAPRQSVSRTRPTVASRKPDAPHLRPQAGPDYGDSNMLEATQKKPPLPKTAQQNASKSPAPESGPTPPPAAIAAREPAEPRATPQQTPTVALPRPAEPVAPPPAAVSAPGGTQAEYERALELARTKRTAEARPLFKAFLSKNPNSPHVPNAMYWLGETYYADGEYDQAILSFKEVAGRFPKHAKAAAAMLKVGYAYEQLADLTNARFYLQTLIDEYPKSEPARLAREKLNKIPE